MNTGGLYLLLLFIAVLPGLLICWYIYRTDKYEHEPRAPLALAFFAGIVTTFAIIKLEFLLGAHLHMQHLPLPTELALGSVYTALAEELLKFLALLLILYPWAYFDEPMDGIVYAVMVAMGFATTENVLYALEYGLGTTILRAFTAVPAHAVFAIIMGYFLGKAKFQQEKRKPYLLIGLVLATAAHSVYDFLLLQRIYEWLVVLAVVFIWLAIYFEQELIKDQQNHSPFK